MNAHLCKLHADFLIERTNEYVRRGVSHFHGDPEMVEMFRRDQLDYRVIAKMIRDGDLSSAYERACQMDTAARDEIPVSVWMWMESNGEY